MEGRGEARFLLILFSGPSAGWDGKGREKRGGGKERKERRKNPRNSTRIVVVRIRGVQSGLGGKGEGEA
jgi:hypothetical protein